jgi:hypothetical protein
VIEVVHLKITCDDICNARHYGISDPVTFALLQCTRTPWRVSPCGIGMELAPPHRTFIFRGCDFERWHFCRAYGFDAPTEFRLELHGWE